ncbi:HPr family phosphocarrier protein [Reinekea marinisedimentorum]|uniref:Phosphocarrier protein n=1 Tax=Reinekea marinisedimentorum TaxID=230495 RepID=A0A4R3I195_9GAMM|nr:HPr family phosphocarrier protein [Reinekea marinisedimentorum]TCS37619.1 phosphocarrier protein [Reinekea marinisedimentorum]
MIKENITIINKLGLHARAAAKLVGTASHYASTIQVAKEGRQADAKSIMAVMMLAASKGTELTFTIEGTDEASAWEGIKTLISNRFDEDE